MPALTYSEIEAAMPATALTTVQGLPYRKIASGKVRELFDTGEHLLMIATDRISAFDVVMPNGVPGKGIILTQIARHWFEQSRDLVPNHLLDDHDAALAAVLGEQRDLAPRSMLVRKLKPLPVEAVVRGYLSGSGWKEYRTTGALWGQPVPPKLRESEALPRPYFTPTSKAHVGHDEPMTLEQCSELLTGPVYRQVLDTSLRIYEMGREQAARAGIILADTKFEFGLDEAGRLHLIDEVMTPDSSRFWPADEYQVGRTPPSFDKQYVRDYLDALAWDKRPPAPALPPEVVEGTRERYMSAARKLIG